MLDEPSAGMSPAAAEDLAATLLDVRDRLHRTCCSSSTTSRWCSESPTSCTS
jgi:ABC-type transporter Mla maintaining outer membrane lipid asymmetry ATPase subunit MlaF